MNLEIPSEVNRRFTLMEVLMRAVSKPNRRRLRQSSADFSLCDGRQHRLQSVLRRPRVSQSFKFRFSAIVNTLLIASMLALTPHAWPHPPQPGFLIYGKVSLPNGRPASHVVVKINGLTGLDRQTQTDDQGSYQFPSIPGGRYRVQATSPADSSLSSDPVEADTSRSGLGNRVQVHIHMRAASSNTKETRKPGVLSVAEATQRVPKDARKAYEQGLKLKDDKKSEQALASFGRAIEIYPEYFQALAARGDVHVGGGKIDQAFEDFERALKLNGEYVTALRGAGFCELQRQKLNEAARYFVRALDVDPNDANSHLFLGITLIGLNQSALAEQALRQALKIDAEAAMTAHVYMADIYTRDRQYKQAADELQTYIRARPNAPNADRLKKMEADLRGRAQSAPK